MKSQVLYRAAHPFLLMLYMASSLLEDPCQAYMLICMTGPTWVWFMHPWEQKMANQDSSCMQL